MQQADTFQCMCIHESQKSMVLKFKRFDKLTRPSSAPLPRRQGEQQSSNLARKSRSSMITLQDYNNDENHEEEDRTHNYNVSEGVKEEKEDEEEEQEEEDNYTPSLCFRRVEEKINVDDVRVEAFQDSSEHFVLEPPRIKRSSSDFVLGIQQKCFEEQVTETLSEEEDFSRFTWKDEALNDMKDWEPRGDNSDESTVIISNISTTSDLFPNKVRSVERKIGVSEERHESLLDVFHIKLTSPLKLPKEKRWSKINEIMRSSTHRSVNAAVGNDVTEKSGIDDYWFHDATFNQLQQYVLLGVPLNLLDVKKFRSPPRIGLLLKKSNEILKRTQTVSPARKLDSILSRKPGHRRMPSDSVQRIKAILSRKSVYKVKIPVKSEWCRMDDAVSGRLDGLDVISMGPVRNVSYVCEKQKGLSGQRYNLRCMILDSLRSASGRDPSEIVFEGFSQRGQGSDRWTTRIEDWKSCDTEGHNHLWGKGNSPPPPCESKLSKMPSSPTSTAADIKLDIYVIRTLEQLHAAHEHAVAPLKLGHVHESIKVFQKILRSLQAKYKNGRELNHVIGSTCHNIATLCMWQGCFEDALNYMNMAVSIRVKTLGYFHASVAVSFAKLGIIYFALERLGSSIRSFTQALDIRRKLSDEDSVQTAKILNNLGVALFHQGEKGSAIDRLIDALRIQKKWIEESLCRDCSIFDTSITLSNLAKIYYSRDDSTMAAYLYEEALQLQTSILKKDHQDVLSTLCNIARAKAMAGEITNSLQIFKTLHNIQSVKFGHESREAVETKGFMSILLIQQSNYTVALRYLNDVLKWQRAHLDENDPSLTNTMSITEQISHTINRI